ncbi:MAG: hypothetical protein EOP86_16120 [Verrucomicrobiaceae bacterium]|nr:MAG: hypothetical protein EOP86_16120 [Verrucomicrobiaceae bacterium]
MIELAYSIPLGPVLHSVEAVARAVGRGHERGILHQAIARRLEEVTRDYLDQERGTTHSTARKLGAEPTGFYKKAAGSVVAKGDSSGVVLTMQRAGLSRAFRDYHIRPRWGPKLLTIPVDKEAYGKRARDFTGLVWRRFGRDSVAAGYSTYAGLVLGRPGGGPGGSFKALFRGAKYAFIPMRRSILPSDAEWSNAAEEGVYDYIDSLT